MAIRENRRVLIFFGALLAFWVAVFASYRPQFNIQHPGDGTYKPIRARGDGHYYYLYTLSMALDRDLDIVNQYKTLGDPFNAQSELSPTGRPHMRPIGSAILQLPAFLLAHGSASVLNLFGAHIKMHGYTPWHQTITFLGNLLAGLAGLWFAFQLARRYTSEIAALYGVLFVGVGTGLLFYACYWTSYNHTFSALFAAWFAEYWDRTRGRFDARRYAGLGALLGFLALTRQQDIVFAVVPAIEGLIELGRRARRGDLAGVARLAANGLLAGAIMIAILSPQLYVFKQQYGGIFNVVESDERQRLDSPFFWEVLFSSRAGLFVWTPMVYLCAIGLFLAPRSSWRISLPLIGLFLVEVWICGAAWSWDGGWSYGGRRLVVLSGMFVVGAAFLVERLRAVHRRWPRLAPHAALILAVAPLLLINTELSCSTSQFKQQVSRSQSATTLLVSSIDRMAEMAHNGAGSPPTWPASWIWALRHGVKPEAYDFVVGTERMAFPPQSFRKKGFSRVEAIGFGGGLGALSGGGWAAPTAIDGHRVMVAQRGRARVLVPLHVAEDMSLSLLAAPVLPTATTVDVAVNGEHTQVTFPPGFSTQSIPMPAGTLDEGTNNVDVTCPELPCLAVEKLVITYTVP